jgi:RHS repeat-associated protein
MTNSTNVERARMRARRALLVVSTILCTGLAVPALAQSAAPAPVRNNIDANGVDLFSGTMNVDGPTLSAGNGTQGITWQRSLRGNRGWFDTLNGVILSNGGSTVWVSFGPVTDSFTKSGSTFTSTEGNGSTLTLSGTNYTYTASDGTIAIFNTAYAPQTYSFPLGGLVSVKKPSGLTFTYNYDNFVYCYQETPGNDNCDTYNTIYHISSIVTNTGYRITPSYNNWDPTPIEQQQSYNGLALILPYYDITGVALTNTAITGASTRSENFTQTSISDAMARTTNYRFSNPVTGVAAGNVLLGITHAGKSSEDVTLTYDGSNRVYTLTNPVGTTTYTYSDASGIRTTTVTDPGGHATVYTFDISLQRVKSVTTPSPISKTTTWTYDAFGRVTRVTAPETNYTQYTYDTRGNVTETRKVAKSGSGLSDIVLDTGYDTTCGNAVTCNRPNWTKDAKGNQTDYTYDTTTGNPSTVTSPAAATGGIRPKTSYSYTTTNGMQLLTGTSTCQTTASCVGTADESKRTIGYNTNLLPTTIAKAAGDNSVTATTTIGYDDVGNVLAVDGPLSGTADTTTFRYDADREQIGVISADPDGAGALKRRAVRTTYNVRGIVTLTELGTVNGTADADWSAFTSLQQTAVSLDAADRKAQVTMAAGGTTYSLTQYSYDIEGRLDCVAVRMKPSTYTSLPTSACTSTTGTGDADRITKMTYDNANRVTKTTSGYGTLAASDDSSTTYTDNGQAATVTDAEGNKTGYTYDGFDRLSKTNYPSPTKGSGTSSSTDYEQLGYDANSNVTSRLLRGGTLTIGYAYDNLNRLKTKDLPGSELDVTYGYDLLGRRTSAATASQTLSFTYDALGRNLTQTGPIGTVGYQYDAAGRRTRLTWPDLFYVTYDYLVTGEMTAVKESGTTTLGTYAYDDLGRRTSLTRGNGVITTYGYDNISRLTSLTSDLAGTAYDLTLGFGYNAASQITSTTRSNNVYSWTGATNVARNYTSNGLNQYSATTSTAFGFDARGNLTSSGSNAYTYSSENLLLTGPNSVSLTYDPLMRLYLSGGVTITDTKNLYDGDQPIALYLASTGALAERYVMGPGTDEPLLVYKTGGVKYWVITDERGSTISDADSSGTPQVTNTYDEYGIPGAGNALRMQYTGQVWLSELGMYYYKARMYSPTLGRFMQTDPIGYKNGLNLYNYTGSDAINRIDPSGLTYMWYQYCPESNYPTTSDGDGGDIVVASASCQDVYIDIPNDPASAHYPAGGMGVPKPGPGDYQRDNNKNKDDNKNCEKVAAQPGAVAVVFVNATFIPGMGYSGSPIGTFYNMKTGSGGFFTTDGGGWGLDAGLGLQGGFYRSAADLSGTNWNINAQYVVAGSLNFSSDWDLVGGSIGGGGDAGGSLTISSTGFFGCYDSE